MHQPFPHMFGISTFTPPWLLLSQISIKWPPPSPSCPHFHQLTWHDHPSTFVQNQSHPKLGPSPNLLLSQVQAALFVKYDKNKNFGLLLDPIPIKCLPEVTKVLRSLNAPNIKECDCIDAWQLFARHFVTESYHIKVIDFDQS